MPHTRQILRQMRRSAARHGIAPTLHRSLYQLAQKALVLDVTYLMLIDADSNQTQECERRQTPRLRSIDFDFLGNFDLLRLSREPDNLIAAELADRLDSGLDYCFAAMADGQLASYCWLALESIEPQHNRGAHLESGVGLSYSRNAAFIYNGFTHPKFRGRGIYPHLIRNASVAMREQGVKYLLSTADWTNHSALRGCRTSGKKRIGMIWRVGRPGQMKTLAHVKQTDGLQVIVGNQAEITERSRMTTAETNRPEICLP